MTRVAVLAGDGIGPEVTEVAVEALQAAGFDGTFTKQPVGWACWAQDGDALPPATLDACRRADAVLFGAITSKPTAEATREGPLGAGPYRSPILRLRQELGLWANVRPCQGRGVDLVLWRENTECLYTDREAKVTGLPAGAGVDVRIITPAAARRICDAAFNDAARRGRSRVTLLEKANVLRRSGAVMLAAFQAAAAEHPDIEARVENIDAACAGIVTDPGAYDVVVASNLFGDIFSDVAAAVAGGLPQAASANLGDGHALFEPVHGSAPDIAGQGSADPRGAVRAAAMLARHVGQTDVADRMERALDACVGHDTASWRASLLSHLERAEPSIEA